MDTTQNTQDDDQQQLDLFAGEDKIPNRTPECPTSTPKAPAPAQTPKEAPAQHTKSSTTTAAKNPELVRNLGRPGLPRNHGTLTAHIALHLNEIIAARSAQSWAEIGAYVLHDDHPHRDPDSVRRIVNRLLHSRAKFTSRPSPAKTIGVQHTNKN